MKSDPVPLTQEHFDSIRALVAKEYGLEGDELDKVVDELTEVPELWVNFRYTVSVDRREDGSVSCLSIRRNDRKPVRDWRDFQFIKNQIAGEDVEAVELYPKQDRVVDTANQYFLWCMPPGDNLPLGFPVGKMLSESGVPNTAQRPLPEEWSGDDPEQ
jgi:hypothetical protein